MPTLLLAHVHWLGCRRDGFGPCKQMRAGPQVGGGRRREGVWATVGALDHLTLDHENRKKYTSVLCRPLLLVAV